MSNTRRLCSLFQCARFLIVLAVLIDFTACGGGGGNGAGTPPPPSSDFGITVTPTGLALTPGTSANATISISAQGGFTSSVKVDVSGLPAGVSANPSSISTVPGTPASITLSTAQDAPVGSGTVTLTGTSGALTHSAQLTMSVVLAPESNTPLFRTRWVRTDAATPYGSWINSRWILYDPVTRRFFVTDPFTGHVFVMDAASQHRIGTIAVPGAFSIDRSPDGAVLWVSSLSGDLYKLDPVRMEVTRRYIASQIGPYGFRVNAALALADGRMALLGAMEGIPSVDGAPAFGIWNEADNSITLYTSGYGSSSLWGLPYHLVCGTMMGNIGGFALNAERTKVFVGSIFSDNTLCMVDPTTGKDLYVTAVGDLNKILVTPDGKYLVFPAYSQGELAEVYDAHNLARLREFTVRGDTSSASGFTVSGDGKTLYTPSSVFVSAYDLESGRQIGWYPNISVRTVLGGYTVGPSDYPYYQAIDETGLLAGPTQEGVGFLDTTTMHTGAVGTGFLNGYLDPASGVSGGGTETQWSNPNPVDSALGKVYFGSRQAPSAWLAWPYLKASTPPGAPGPADVYVFVADGGMQLLPEAFSYGPTILQVAPNLSTSEGGGTGWVYGYGFGSSFDGTIAPELTITVGGRRASIRYFVHNVYGVSGQPFQLQAVGYAIPQGVVGPADVTVTTNAGSANAIGGMTYMEPVEKYALPGGALVQGIYDPHWDVYYFTDTDRIRVFSLSQREWLPSIAVPGRTSSQRLYSLALSPNGKWLAISDAGDNVIYVLDPANTGTIRTHVLPSDGSGPVHAAALAVTDSGVVYFSIYPEANFSITYKLDAVSGTLTNLDFGRSSTQDKYMRAAISADSVRVFFNHEGLPYMIDTATDRPLYATFSPGCCYGDNELTLSANQTSLSATSYFYDADLNGRAFMGFNWREFPLISYVYGAKLSPDGRMLFQPGPDFIDVFNAMTGTLHARVALPVILSSSYDALVANGRDNVLLAITEYGDSIAVVDVTSIPVPDPLPYELTSQPAPGSHAQFRLESSSERKHDSTRRSQNPITRKVPHITRPAPGVTQNPAARPN